jgi:hypothetical protein
VAETLNLKCLPEKLIPLHLNGIWWKNKISPFHGQKSRINQHVSASYYQHIPTISKLRPAHPACPPKNGQKHIKVIKSQRPQCHPPTSSASTAGFSAGGAGDTDGSPAGCAGAGEAGDTGADMAHEVRLRTHPACAAENTWAGVEFEHFDVECRSDY